MFNKKEYMKKYRKIYYKEHKKYFKKYNKEYRNRPEQKIKQKEYDKISRTKLENKIKDKKYKIKNKIKQKNYEKIYRTKPEIKIKINEYRRNRLKTDLNFKIASYLRTRIWLALKGNPKLETTMKLLGCSIEFLKEYLQARFKEGMNWFNQGNGWNERGMKEWHIDHIKPCASFDLSKLSEQKKCFHYTNLQSLWARENIIKSNKFDKEKKI